MSFTPIKAALGALFIQLSTTNYYLQNGQTVGFSSAISNLVLKPTLDSYSLVTGVLLSTQLIKHWYPQFISSYPLSNLVGFNKFFDYDYKLFIVAGLLVGLGTKLGSGCTSGHMIGGLSRLRYRSFIATCVFSATAIATVTLLNLQLSDDIPKYIIASNDSNIPKSLWTLLLSSFGLVYGILPIISKKLRTNQTINEILKTFNSLFTGFLFGIGLHVSGMINVSKTIGFLSILTPNSFDPSLLMIVLFTIIPNIFVWKSIKAPLLSNKFNCATSNEITKKFLIGNVLFGLGWGLLGICPGPGLINSVHHFPILLTWLGSFIVGSFIGTKL